MGADEGMPVMAGCDGAEGGLGAAGANTPGQGQTVHGWVRAQPRWPRWPRSQEPWAVPSAALVGTGAGLAAARFVE